MPKVNGYEIRRRGRDGRIVAEVGIQVGSKKMPIVSVPLPGPRRRK